MPASKGQSGSWSLVRTAHTQDTGTRPAHTQATLPHNTMSNRIRITTVLKNEPDLDRFVAALLALALARLEAEADDTSEAKEARD